MLIARAPVRVSFFGGGTDLPEYYNEFGGSVLSASIDKYVYAILSVNQGHPLQITSSDYRTFYRHPRGQPLLWEGDLSLPRAVFQHFGIEDGISVFLASEVPPGTGLGSSSSVTVALAKAITVACGRHLNRLELASLACEIELGRLGMPIGVQDQYASALGGFNWLSFSNRGVSAEPLDLPPHTIARLESNLVLIFTGSARNSADILSRQRKSSESRDPSVIDALSAVRELAAIARAHLRRGDLDRFGRLLDEAWQHKKRFARGISSDQVDNLYAIARANGALGGKLTGAGGGGFLMLYCEDGAAARVEAALREAGDFRRMEYTFEYDGARVLFNAGLRLPLAEQGDTPWPATVRTGL
jgi:D-glycero-alpha-D-manno-heptose-7-phosphate kinase